MNTKQVVLAQLKEIISEHLGIDMEEITENSTWIDLGADSLDRLAISLAIESALNVDIPHTVGERLNTVGETIDYLLHLAFTPTDRLGIGIEGVSTNQQWAEMSSIRTQVFSMQYTFPFSPLLGPGAPGVWHFLARHGQDAVGTLSVVDTTGNQEVHDRHCLKFRTNDRVARYAQLAILKPYRKRGIFEMLIEAAQKAVIQPHGFAFGWLLYPAERAGSSMLTRSLGFSAELPVLKTEFGKCHVLVRREPALQHVN